MKREKKIVVLLAWALCFALLVGLIPNYSVSADQAQPQKQESSEIKPTDQSTATADSMGDEGKDNEKQSEPLADNSEKETGTTEQTDSGKELQNNDRGEKSENKEQLVEDDGSQQTTGNTREQKNTVIQVKIDPAGGSLDEDFNPGTNWQKDNSSGGQNVWCYTISNNTEDSVIFQIEDPVWEGHTFDQWKSSSTSIEKTQEGYKIPLNNNENMSITLTAQWKEKYSVDITAATWVSRFTNQYKDNVIKFSHMNSMNMPSLEEMISTLNDCANQLKVSYTITYESAEGEKKVTRTDVILKIQWDSKQNWPEANMDLRELKNKIANKQIQGGNTIIRLSDIYLKSLIAEYENGLTLDKLSDSAVSAEEFQFTDWGTFQEANQYYTGGDSDLTKLTVVLGVSNNTDKGISGNTDYMIDTVSPGNVKLNLFDYWLQDKYLNDLHEDTPTTELWSSKVNAGHGLLFRKTNGAGNWNAWTDRTGGVRQGIVQNLLIGGFPILNLKQKFSASGKFDQNHSYNPEESLQYLFDPTRVNQENYGEAYEDVKGLFKINEDGNYYYCSHDNFAEFDSNNNQFNVYNTWGVKPGGSSPQGQFFPFNSADQVLKKNQDGTLTQENLTSLTDPINHYLGLTMEVEFQQPVDGMVSVGEKAKPMTFDFSGDDDVWIFIDDVLVADLGGIHDEMSVSIDFSTGDIHIQRANNPTDSTSIDTTIGEQFQKVGRTDSLSGNTFAGHTTHTLKMFYLERGNTDSNLTLSFNLMEPADSQIIKLDQDGEPVENAGFAMYVAEVDEKGQPIAVGDNSYKTAEEIFSGTSDKEGVITIPADYDYSKHTYYVLRETAPEGYFGPGDVLLKYDKYQKKADGTSSGTNLLLVDNRWTTGAVGNFSATIYQSGDLYYSEDSENPIDRDVGKKGLILAVPLMKGTDGIWSPMYGSNLAGFEIISAENDQRKAILEAALLQIYGAEYGNQDGYDYGYQKWYLEWNEDTDRYQGTLNDLPGDATRYYWASGSEYADMSVAYYFLDLSQLESIFGNITEQNAEEKLAAIAEKVNESSENENSESIKSTVEALASEILAETEKKTFGLLDVSLFNRIFGSRIYIPNTEPELRVRKLDQNGEPVEGVTFSLYNNQSCSGNALASGTTDSEGLIVFSKKGTVGAGSAPMYFEGNTTYYLKETKAPEGYQVKDEIVPVYVTDDGRVYADALEKNDGITVRKGLGKLVQTMAKYAGSGSIDGTLRDITGKLFTVDSFDRISSAIQKNTGDENGEELNFCYGATNAILEYGTHEINGVYPNPYFEVDENIAGMIVHQNYDAHEGDALYDTFAQKTDLDDINIRGLFTGSTTVVVRNRIGESGAFSIKKTVSGTDVLENAQFQFDVTIAKTGNETTGIEEEINYPYIIKNTEGILEQGRLSFESDGDKKWKIKNAVKEDNSNSQYINQENDKTWLICLKQDEIITVQGIPFDLEVTVKETDQSSSGYVTSVSVNNGTWSQSTSASGIVARPIGDPSFVFHNHKDKIADLTLKKTVSEGGDQTKEFPFSITLRDKNGADLLTGEYSWEITEGDDSEPEQDHSGTITDGKLNISLKHGEKLTIKNLPVDSTYLIRETTMGYSPSVTINGETVNVVDGAVSGSVTESSGDVSSTDVVYTNTKSGSITITKRNGTGDILSGAGFTLYTVDGDGKKDKVGAEQLTRLAMRCEIKIEDQKFDQDAMRYNDGDNSYIVHKTKENDYFYYRFLTDEETDQYQSGILDDKENVEAIVQFTGLDLNETYAIEETRVPEGYVQNAEMSGKLARINLPMGEDENTVYDVLYTVTNHNKLELPVSGLKGIVAFLGIGIFLIAASAVLWRFRKRRCK